MQISIGGVRGRSGHVTAACVLLAGAAPFVGCALHSSASGTAVKAPLQLLHRLLLASFLVLIHSVSAVSRVAG